MSIVFNFKVCDNAAECNGIGVCAPKAITWDEKNQMLVVDNSKCTSCGLCVNACPVEGAILVAKTDEELKEMKAKIDDMDFSRAELLEERYGVTPTDQGLVLNEKTFQADVLNSDRVVLVDFWNADSISCRVKAIRFDEMIPKQAALPALVGQKCIRFRFRKVDVDKNPELMKRYNVEKIPSLLIFYNGNLISRIDGRVLVDEKEKVQQEVKAAIQNLKE